MNTYQHSLVICVDLVPAKINSLLQKVSKLQYNKISISRSMQCQCKVQLIAPHFVMCAIYTSAKGASSKRSQTQFFKWQRVENASDGQLMCPQPIQCNKIVPSLQSSYANLTLLLVSISYVDQLHTFMVRLCLWHVCARNSLLALL